MAPRRLSQGLHARRTNDHIVTGRQPAQRFAALGNALRRDRRAAENRAGNPLRSCGLHGMMTVDGLCRQRSGRKGGKSGGGKKE